MTDQAKQSKLRYNVWQGIALVGELQRDGSLMPDCLAWLAKLHDAVLEKNIRVSLILIGSGLDEKAKVYFNSGTDRVFVYDDPALSELSEEKRLLVVQHFTENYNPLRLLFPDKPYYRTIAAKIEQDIRDHLGKACRSGMIDSESALADILTLDQDPQIGILQFFPAKVPEAKKAGKGELIMCEIPEILSKSSEN